MLLACDWRVVVHVGAPESLCTQLKLVGSEFSYLAQNEDLQKTDKKAGLYALAPHAARGLYPPAASSWHSERPASSVPCVGAHGCSPIVIWGVDAVKKSRTQCHPLASTRRRRAQPAAAARATLAHANRHLAGSENDITSCRTLAQPISNPVTPVGRMFDSRGSFAAPVGVDSLRRHPESRKRRLGKRG